MMNLEAPVRIREKEYCNNYAELEMSATAGECAAQMFSDERCQGGKGIFVHSAAVGFCSCCTDEDALKDTSEPIVPDLHMYDASH